jgi:hypothetical protein
MQSGKDFSNCCCSCDPASGHSSWGRQDGGLWGRSGQDVEVLGAGPASSIGTVPTVGRLSWHQLACAHPAWLRSRSASMSTQVIVAAPVMRRAALIHDDCTQLVTGSPEVPTIHWL